MRMKRKRLKAAMLSIAVAAGMLLPGAVRAQSAPFSGNPINNQTFGASNQGNIDNQIFGASNKGNIDNQAFGASNEGNITNQTFGNKLPLGSGLAVLVAAGAGYAVLRRRKK